MHLEFDNSFARALPAFYSACAPEKASAPEIVYFNRALANEIAPALNTTNNAELRAFLSGNQNGTFTVFGMMTALYGGKC